MRGRVPGFTLVEMLVVIAIIGVLLALVTVAGYTAISHVRAHTISVDINNLEGGITAYKAKMQDFPPDCSNATVFERHLRKIFPRHRENVPVWLGTSPNDQLDESEALVFFLGGGLKDNPELPLTGPGQPKKFYDFPANRLVDLDGDGHLSFVQAYGQQQVPYVYFDSRTYSVASHGNATIGFVFPYKTDAPLAASQPNYEWESPTTFQIVAAGLDGNFGTWPGGTPSAQPYKYYPSGAIADPNATDGSRPNGTPYDREDRDNVTSFAEGALESKLP
jgi:prepilin-type N-terminal cleavage/methylation domain-containing protein